MTRTAYVPMRSTEIHTTTIKAKDDHGNYPVHCTRCGELTKARTVNEAEMRKFAHGAYENSRAARAVWHTGKRSGRK